MNNTLLVGNDKTFLLEHLREPYLFIDDGSLIDLLDIPPRRKVTYIDWDVHTFNPLRGMNYKKARDFVSILGAVFPQGDNTLTRKNSDFWLLKTLLGNTTKLDRLFRGTVDDPGYIDAQQKIQTLLLSPVLKRVLTTTGQTIPQNGIWIARIDRAELGDFDAFVLGNLLIGQFQGQVVVPDFGFYGREHHITLLRQNRLVAGVNYLAELPDKLRAAVLLMSDRHGKGANYDDAVVLAHHDGKFYDPLHAGAWPSTLAEYR